MPQLLLSFCSHIGFPLLPIFLRSQISTYRIGSFPVSFYAGPILGKSFPPRFEMVNFPGFHMEGKGESSLSFAHTNFLGIMNWSNSQGKVFIIENAICFLPHLVVPESIVLVFPRCVSWYQTDLLNFNFPPMFIFPKLLHVCLSMAPKVDTPAVYGTRFLQCPRCQQLEFPVRTNDCFSPKLKSIPLFKFPMASFIYAS